MADVDKDFRPFARFAPPVRAQTALRRAITAATRSPEILCVPPLVAQATVSSDVRHTIAQTATQLITAVRAKGTRTGVEGLVREYALSSDEGVALMCLAEALLRIPDTATRDALIRDKVAGGDWQAHLGSDRSLFVNGATWGLVVTGKLGASTRTAGLGAVLTRLIARCGEPVIRRGVDLAMRMMGEQFVTGESIGEALARARRLEARGFSYSYDMLGEAATTMSDADRYFADYARAIHAIGKAAAGRGVYAGPGISVKLSALHPRYSRAQSDRVIRELLPRVMDLAALAQSYDIGFNIDAEEADRLELSLDLLEALALDPALGTWQGLGFVVQAYGKRCPFVLDFVIDLARRAQRRIMVRLVKGAYWDTEIKRAQVDGQADFPVYTRKIYTDVAYIACARKLLAARDAVFPQFATHNAQTLATIYTLAGADFALGDYEFQCLHGMGEPLYDEVVGPDKLDRPCRIYAPVGSHENLLAYLVRRLLENGANSSFVNRIADPQVPVADLVADPAVEVATMAVPGAAHAGIVLPAALYPDRQNSAGIDLTDETALAALSDDLCASTNMLWTSHYAPASTGERRIVTNPGDRRDVVGEVIDASAADIAAALTRASAAAPGWAATDVAVRTAALDRAADAMQARMPILLGLIAREAGKSIPNAIAEVREAIDFLRYYAVQARATLTASHRPLGPVVCISPWNFPLAIFTGQIAAALVAGNPALAKPAEETPLIAAECVSLLHAAGIPVDVLHLLPGDGDVGAALVDAEAVCGVMFTGSTDVARSIQRQLATRLLPGGAPVPLVAETGGQNAMIVDSSALPEQVVADVITSAFDSAGQRCSALRLLCIQDDIADPLLEMLRGALAELSIGRTDRLAIDIGPVITENARDVIVAHIEDMRRNGRRVDQIGTPGNAHGVFVPPTIIELDTIDELVREVFGPVLHVVRYRRDTLDALIDAINATGYGLTFGLHTRIDETIAHVTARINAGNIYVNRNLIGAVVGTQPFGGHGLSGTGPKAGGPLYLGRLVRQAPYVGDGNAARPAEREMFDNWLATQKSVISVHSALPFALSEPMTLPGPVGERNVYTINPRGCVLLLARSVEALDRQLAAVLATGNRALVAAPSLQSHYKTLPAAIAARIAWTTDGSSAEFDAVLIDDGRDEVVATLTSVAARAGPLCLVQTPGLDGYRLDWLVSEVSMSINTTAAGGNAQLMMLDDDTGV